MPNFIARKLSNFIAKRKQKIKDVGEWLLATILPKLKVVDKDLPFDYGPISNLNNIFKFLARLILNRIRDLISSSTDLNPFQSSYRKFYSNETALLLALDNIYHSIDHGSSTLLVCLHLRSAFDTTDHHIILNILKPDSAFIIIIPLFTGIKQTIYKINR